MTRSIFDPTGPETERSGNPFMGPDADNRSRMPEDAVDGVAGEPQEPNDTIDMTPAKPEDAASESPNQQE